MAIDRRRLGGGYLPLREVIDQLFEGSFITPQVLSGQGAFPSVDVHTTDEDVVIDLALPGVNPDDINISVTGETVTVSGEIKRTQRSEKHQPLAEEIWRGRFQRSFQLPIQVDANKTDASFDQGILRLRLPKSESTKPRKIQVRQGQHTISQNDEGNQQSEPASAKRGRSS